MTNPKKWQDAKLEAVKLHKVPTMPLPKFREGQDVTMDNHDNRSAIVLKVNFNHVIWMYSYVISPNDSLEIIEIMEAGLSGASEIAEAV